jgi:large subunit ribosomal protein L5
VSPRLKDMYRTEVVPKLMEDMSYANINQVPRLDKIATQDTKLLDAAVEDMRIITGQQPMITRARKSIASFKLRKGMPIGAKVTLRGDRMWEFLDRLLATALPRIRDFRGINPNSFDGRGNYSMGVDEQLIFAEVDYDKVDRTRGMDITFVTTAKTDGECRALLDAFAFPFKR